MLYILAIVELIAAVVFGFELLFGANVTLFMMSGAISVILGTCLMIISAGDLEEEEA